MTIYLDIAYSISISIVISIVMRFVMVAVTHVPTAHAFTKENRSFAFTGQFYSHSKDVHTQAIAQDIVISFDVAFETLWQSSQKACVLYGCNDTELVDIARQTFQYRIDDHLQISKESFQAKMDEYNMDSLSLPESRGHWLANADQSSKEEHLQRRKDILIASKGIDSIRVSCLEFLQRDDPEAMGIVRDMRYRPGQYPSYINAEESIVTQDSIDLQTYESKHSKGPSLPNSCRFMTKYCELRERYNHYEDVLIALSQANVYMREFFIWTQLSEIFVNEGQLEYALAIAHVAYHNIFPLVPTYKTNNRANDLSSSNRGDVGKNRLEKMLSRLLVVLTEVSSEVEDYNLGSHYGLLLLSSLERQEEWSRLILHRLRLISAIPAIPRTYDESQYYRKLLEGDIVSYGNNLADLSITVSLEELQVEVQRTPFHLAHQGLNDFGFQVALSRALRSMCPQLSFTASHLSKTTDEHAPQLTDSAPRPLKIGFISAHFTGHSIGKIMLESILYFKELAEEVGNIIVYVFYVDNTVYFDKPTGQFFRRTDEEQNWATRTFMNAFSNRFVFLPTNISAARATVAEYGLDFLLYTDLGMDFGTYAIAHARLARYQAAWWGHPITSGLPSIDYYFGLDSEVKIAGSDHYSEQLIRMDFMSSAPVTKSQTQGTPLSSLGLPPDSRYCLIIGRLFKLHPEFDKAMANIILYSNMNSRLVFITESVGSWNDVIFRRLVKTLRLIYYDLLQMGHLPTVEESGLVDGGDIFQLNGRHYHNLSSYIAKIRFVHYSQHYVDALESAAVVLDTFPYGGCLTTHDALSSGIPMVTFPLEHVRGRYTLGMYRQMGLSDLVASSIVEYVELVLRLLKDDDFQREQSQMITDAYYHRYHKNREVAIEWLDVIRRIVR